MINPNTIVEILTEPRNHSKLDPNEACYVINARIALEDCNTVNICAKIYERIEEIMDKHNLRPKATMDNVDLFRYLGFHEGIRITK